MWHPVHSLEAENLVYPQQGLKLGRNEGGGKDMENEHEEIFKRKGIAGTNVWK